MRLMHFHPPGRHQLGVTLAGQTAAIVNPDRRRKRLVGKLDAQIRIEIADQHRQAVRHQAQQRFPLGQLGGARRHPLFQFGREFTQAPLVLRQPQLRQFACGDVDQGQILPRPAIPGIDDDALGAADPA